MSADFCNRGGRFGTHSSNENFTPIHYKRVLFLAHFNAGVRAVDIRDPFNPKEIGYYIPAITGRTDKRCVGTGADERCKVAIQTNNVEVDDRGYIYIVDRANTGMHILELTGAARKVARFPERRISRPACETKHVIAGQSRRCGARLVPLGIAPHVCSRTPGRQRITTPIEVLQKRRLPWSKPSMKLPLNVRR
jgi:hypothetical protein